MFFLQFLDGILMLNILVVIINYKTPELVIQAVLSVIPQLGEADKICIVDNSSGDKSVSYLFEFIEKESLENKVSLIASPINGGFSAGNNIGINSEEAEYYLLLNSDAYLTEGALPQLINEMHKADEVGIVVPQLTWSDSIQQTSCFYLLTPFNSFIQSAKTGVVSQMFSLFGGNEIAIPLEKHRTVQAEWLSFACVLLNNKMIKEIGLMDEGYFMYYEDMDYCRRASKQGWTLNYAHDAKVVHLNQGDSNHKTIKRLPRYYFNSRSRYFLKYYGRSGLLISNVLWSLGRIISFCREKTANKSPVFHCTMFKDVWVGFFTSLKEEKHG